MTTLAHITDLHLPLHGRLRRGELMGKRAFSALNWARKRRRTHLVEVAEAMADDLVAHEPDHIAVTGDTVNFGLPREFEAGAAWMDRFGAPEDVSFVPGNHEAILKGVEAKRDSAFARFTTGDDGQSGYPWLRKRGEIALIGVSTSVSTPPFFAQGKVGDAQLVALKGLLLATKGMCRIILIHHPPSGPCKPRKRLLDAEAFRDVVAAGGAELVLHGHNHKALLSWIDTKQGRTPVVGAPSASIGHGWRDHPAEWRLFDVKKGAEGFDVTMRRRRITPTNGVEDYGVFKLSPPRPLL